MDGILGGLEILSAVVHTGSFVRAGERVGLTQSGVSRAVARLEDRVGVRLFDRNARAVILTDEGRRFYESVAPLVSAIEDAVTSTSGSKTRVSGKLRINVDPFFSRFVLAAKLESFLSQHPDLELELMVTDRLGNLVEEGFDAAVRFGEPRAQGLVARRLLETRILTCASPAYVKRHGRPQKPHDLAKGHTCIMFRDPQTGRPFEWEFHRKRKIVKVDVHGPLYLNDVATAVEACIAGHGIAQLKELGAAPLLKEGKLVELFPTWHDELFPLYVFHPSRLLPPAKVRAFIDFVTALTKDPGRR